MIVYIEQLINASPIINDIVNQKISMGLSYKLFLAYDEILKKINEFNIEKNNLASQYIKRKPDGSPVYVIENEVEQKDKIELNNPEEFNKKYSELLSNPIELNIIPFNIKDLTEVKIEPSKMNLITWFINFN